MAATGREYSPANGPSWRFLSSLISRAKGSVRCSMALRHIDWGYWIWKETLSGRKDSVACQELCRVSARFHLVHLGATWGTIALRPFCPPSGMPMEMGNSNCWHRGTAEGSALVSRSFIATTRPRDNSSGYYRFRDPVLIPIWENSRTRRLHPLLLTLTETAVKRRSSASVTNCMPSERPTADRPARFVGRWSFRR